jgi:hypothetical protein
MSVFFEADEATLAPRDSAWALASPPGQFFQGAGEGRGLAGRGGGGLDKRATVVHDLFS